MRCLSVVLVLVGGSCDDILFSLNCLNNVFALYVEAKNVFVLSDGNTSLINTVYVLFLICVYTCAQISCNTNCVFCAPFHVTFGKISTNCFFYLLLFSQQTEGGDAHRAEAAATGATTKEPAAAGVSWGGKASFANVSKLLSITSL